MRPYRETAGIFKVRGGLSTPTGWDERVRMTAPDGKFYDMNPEEAEELARALIRAAYAADHIWDEVEP